MGNMIALLFNDIPAPVWAALAGMAALSAAWLTGRHIGAQRTKDKATAKRADDLQKAKDVSDANAKKSDDDVRADLDKWMRPDGD